MAYKKVILVLAAIIYLVPVVVEGKTEYDNVFRIETEWKEVDKNKNRAAHSYFMGNLFISNYEHGVVNFANLGANKNCVDEFCEKQIGDSIKVNYKRIENQEIFEIDKLRNTTTTGPEVKIAFFISTIGSGSIGAFIDQVEMKTKVKYGEKVDLFKLSEVKEKKTGVYWHVFNFNFVDRKIVPVDNCCTQKQLNYSLKDGLLASSFSSIRESIFYNSNSNKSSHNSKNSVKNNIKKRDEKRNFTSILFSLFTDKNDLSVEVDKNYDIQFSNSTESSSKREYDMRNNIISTLSKAIGSMFD